MPRSTAWMLLAWSTLAGCGERAQAAPGSTEPPATAMAAELPTPSPSLIEPSPSTWPAPGARLAALPLEPPKGFGRRRIYLDAGHGAPGNEGNFSVTCEPEESFTLRVAEDLARRLEATGLFRVKLSREAGRRVPYKERLAEAERWRAEAFVSLHSDARGEASWWQPAPGQWCLRNDATPGYSVLWADDAPEPLLSRRLSLARALSQRLGAAGFRPYDGVDYEGLYATDAAQPGVFVSRHQPGRRIFVLRRPRMPSVIIETHHALDLEEAARWREARTLEAFAAAVAQGLVDALSGGRLSEGATRPPQTPRNSGFRRYEKASRAQATPRGR